MRPHPRGTETDPSSPRAWATCERCGLLFNLFKLQWQFDWRGTALMNLRILVCETCLDEPQRQLGTIVLPPDPPPIMNARPEAYAIDELWEIMMEGGTGHGAIPIYLEISTVGNATDHIAMSLELSTIDAD